MWLLYIIIILTISIGVENNDNFENVLRSYTNSHFLQSIKKLRDNVQSFFHLNFDRLERRRKIIQRALHKFIRESMAEDVLSKTTSEVSKSVPRAENVKNLDFVELVAADGYRSDSHVVITNDGYLLTIHRLLPTLSNVTHGKNGIVLLHHGLLGSSDDWILLGPKKGLPYLLLNAEYDVWLANARGNKYSRSHINKNTNDAEFWNFSWHEIGQFDLAAVVDYIRGTSNNNVQLHYVGYSMGATALLVLLSLLPEYNYFFKVSVLIAPLVFMHEVKGPLQLLAQYYNSNTLHYLGIRENSPVQVLSSKLVDVFCKTDTDSCHNPLLLLATGAEEPNESLKSKIVTYTPGGGSIKTIIHYIQLIKSGRFNIFESYFFKNKSPSMYDLNNVVSPIVIFCSLGDWLSTIPDINSLLSHLPNLLLRHTVASEDFNHLDFMWSDKADIFVYYIILDILNQVRITNVTSV